MKLFFQFEGRTDFMFTMDEIQEMVSKSNLKKIDRSSAANLELHVKAQVHDWYLLQNQTGEAISVIYGRHVDMKLLGDPSRTFKPGFPVSIYVSIRSQILLSNYDIIMIIIVHVVDPLRRTGPIPPHPCLPMWNNEQKFEKNALLIFGSDRLLMNRN